MLNIGALFTPPRPAETVTLARACENADFDLFALGDSQSLFREVYTSLTVAAGATSRIRLATGVSNLLTRHIAVTASTAATLREVSGDRFILGLGTGDSAVYNLGLEAMRRAEFAAGIETLRSLWRGDEVEYDGRRIHVRWADTRVPIYMTAEGPKALRLSGQIADGVIVGSGLLPEVVAGSLDLIRAGAHDVGRSLDDIDVWFFAKSNIADSDEQALGDIAMALAASANHAFRFHRDGKWIPPELADSVAELVNRYETRDHEQLGDTGNSRLAADLGLSDYLARRFAVAGAPGSVRSRLQELEAIGVKNLLVAGINPDPQKFVERWASEVRPQLTTT